MKKIIVATLIVAFFSSTFAQNKSNFDFNKYPAKVMTSKKKAPLKNLTNPLTKTYSTDSKRWYNGGEVDFAGHYILIQTGDGYESNAVIADVKTGTIYNIPENDNSFTNESTIKCLNEDALNYKADSNLLVIHNFVGDESDKPVRNQYVWNDKTKKFKKIKSEKLSCNKE